MSFLDKTGLQTLTNKLVQGDAIKVASHRGHTVKNVIDNIQRECDNVANPLEYKVENRIAEFKVGKGRDIDVSGDVENGCTEVALQGKTYQNLFGSKLSIGAKWVETENDYSLILPVGNGQPQILHNLSQPLKPNTTYTLIFDFVRFNSGALFFDFRNDENNISMGNQNISDNSIGIKVRKITTPSENVATKFRMFNVNNKDNDFAFKKHIVILEGDYTQTPIEELPKYFEGIKSSFEDGIVDVEVVGKNMLDDFFLYSSSVKIVEETNNYIITEGSGNIGGGIKFTNVKVKPNTYYSFSMTCQAISPTNHDNIVRVWQPNKKEYITVSLCTISNELTRVKGTFKTPPDCDSIIEIWCGKSSHHSEITRFKFIKDWLLEENAIATQYESYYKKKISSNIGEPLRSLPNGVCDEIRNNNGQWELIRRVGKYTFTGNEGWFDTQMANRNKTRVFACPKVFPTSYSVNKILCNNFSHFPHIWDDLSDREGIVNDREKVMIAINTTKLSHIGWSAFCDWLAKNPTTLYHELATPIVTPIEPIEFDIKPLASININSHIVPTSTHSVELNRASQIERGIVEIAKLKERVDALEVAYDSHFIETQHKLSLLGLEYEIEGGNY